MAVMPWVNNPTNTKTKANGNGTTLSPAPIPAAIHSEADHQALIAQIEAIGDAAPGTPEYTRIHALADVIEAYERTIYQLPEPSDEARSAYQRAKESKGEGIGLANVQ